MWWPWGFSGSASGKEHACQCRRHKRQGFNPWIGKIPWRRHDNPLQCSCLENPMDRRAWWSTGHRLAKSRTQPKWISKHTHGGHMIFGFITRLHHRAQRDSQLHLLLIGVRLGLLLQKPAYLDFSTSFLPCLIPNCSFILRVPFFIAPYCINWLKFQMILNSDFLPFTPKVLWKILKEIGCRGPAPVDPGNSKRGQHWQSGNNCLIKR